MDDDGRNPESGAGRSESGNTDETSAIAMAVERCWQEWGELVAGDASRADLVRFHSRHKFLVLAHDERSYRRLGPLAAGPRGVALRDVLEEYGTTLRAALAAEPSRGTHVNVLQHLAGMCRERLTAAQYARLTSVIAEYAGGREELAAVRALLAHLAEASGATYVAQQSYLAPGW